MRPLVFSVCVGLIISSFGAHAQNAELLRRQADEERKAGRYESAITLYLDALGENDQLAEAHLGLSDTYRLSFRYEEAEKSYRKVRNTWADRFPESIFYHGLMLKLNGNFESSIEEFESFLEKVGDSGRYPDFVEQAYVERAGAQMAMFSVRQGTEIRRATHLESPVNTPFNDFSPEIMENILLITSGRDKGWSARKDLRYGEGFMDQYAFRFMNGSWQQYDLPLLGQVNGKFHEGNGSFNVSRTKYYYTSCGDLSAHCRIFLTELGDDGTWGKPRPLNTNVNRPGFSAKQPSVSAGGDSLFFVSDRPGGAGNNDIWISTSSAGENWGPPQNLTAINTTMNELSPVLAAKNVLLFSSEGHQSYGGFDLYIFNFNGAKDRVVNLGYPINSNRDDAYISLGDTVFYWSSNRSGGSGNFDVYSLAVTNTDDYLHDVANNSPSALRAEVRKDEQERLKKARVNIVNDPFAYESLTDRQKKLINEVIISRRAGRELPSELEYLDEEEKEFILRVANEQMNRSSED